MSEPQPEQTPQPASAQEPAQTTTEQSAPASFPLSFVTIETGRTHGISGGASMDLIRDEQGNPEVEYALVAEINGVQVPLQTWGFSQLNQLAASEQARQQSKQQV